MLLRLGAYDFQANSTKVSTDSEIMRTTFGLPYQIKEMWEVHGWLVKSITSLTPAQSQQELTNMELILRQALRQTNFDISLLQDSGVPSALALFSSGTLNGVNLVKGPAFMGERGDEYAVQREFKFSVEATTDFSPSSDNFLTEFHEEMIYQGGAALWAIGVAVNGNNQRMRIYPKMPFRLIQRGRATGYRRKPPVNPPAFPAFVTGGNENSTMAASPSFFGSGLLRDYTVGWEYTMESVNPLVALPSAWGQA